MTNRLSRRKSKQPKEVKGGSGPLLNFASRVVQKHAPKVLGAVQNTGLVETTKGLVQNVFNKQEAPMMQQPQTPPMLVQSAPMMAPPVLVHSYDAASVSTDIQQLRIAFEELSARLNRVEEFLEKSTAVHGGRHRVHSGRLKSTPRV